MQLKGSYSSNTTNHTLVNYEVFCGKKQKLYQFVFNDGLAVATPQTNKQTNASISRKRLSKVPLSPPPRNVDIVSCWRTVDVTSSWPVKNVWIVAIFFSLLSMKMTIEYKMQLFEGSRHKILHSKSRTQCFSKEEIPFFWRFVSGSDTPKFRK